LNRGLDVKILDCQRGPFEGRRQSNLEFVGVGDDELHGGMADKGVVEQAVTDVDVVYHLAINWDGHTWKHQLPLADLFDVNIRGTLNLLEAARSQSVRHLLFASSCAVYGSQGPEVIDEEAVCKPESWEGDPGRAYGIMKLTTEKLCMLYHCEYAFPTTAFRVGTVFSNSEALPSRSIVENLRSGETIRVARGDGYESIHVDEVIQAFLLATLNPKAYGQVFNLSNPATFITYYELYKFLIRNSGSKSKVKSLVGQAYSGRAKESTRKIRRTLGWKPHKTKDDLKNAMILSLKSM
jgi:nucleoside-diphosphate-sugar epimerase